MPMGGGAIAQPPLLGYAIGVIKASAQLTKGGPCRILHTTVLYANYTILANQRGRAWPDGPPLNTPLVEANFFFF